MHRLDRSLAPKPACLLRFNHPRHDWSCVCPRAKAEIRGCLEKMQGRRCAYCEASIDEMGCHIEHFRRKRDYPGLTFDWDNLLLCCNRFDCCGHHKDGKGWPYNISDLIDPTKEDPDHFFLFRESGGIEVKGGCGDVPRRRATETLRVLHLDQQHGSLRQMRARQLMWYKDLNRDVFDELMGWAEPERREYVRGELAATEAQPFHTIIRHFLQGLA